MSKIFTTKIKLFAIVLARVHGTYPNWIDTPTTANEKYLSSRQHSV